MENIRRSYQESLGRDKRFKAMSMAMAGAEAAIEAEKSEDISNIETSRLFSSAKNPHSLAVTGHSLQERSSYGGLFSPFGPHGTQASVKRYNAVAQKRRIKKSRATYLPDDK